MERLGFYVCVEDLEDELIRAIGTAQVEAVIGSQGDLGSFRSLQRQSQWRGQPTGAQLRRFPGSGAPRKSPRTRPPARVGGLDPVPPSPPDVAPLAIPRPPEEGHAHSLPAGKLLTT